MGRHAITDDDGNVIAAYCGEELDERGQQAMRALVAAHRRATMPDYPDPPLTDDEGAERDALIRMQSWPDGGDH